MRPAFNSVEEAREAVKKEVEKRLNDLVVLMSDGVRNREGFGGWIFPLSDSLKLVGESAETFGKQLKDRV